MVQDSSGDGPPRGGRAVGRHGGQRAGADAAARQIEELEKQIRELKAAVQAQTSVSRWLCGRCGTRRGAAPIG